MNVSEVMSAEAYVASPDEIVRGAAQLMADLGTGVLPIGEGDRLMGVITDRDSAIRVVAAGRDSDLARRTPAEISAGALQGISDDDADDLYVASHS